MSKPFKVFLTFNNYRILLLIDKNKNMKLKLSSFLLFLTTIFINSQTIIHGVVKSEENKSLSYCAIGIKDTDIGAITNENGFYKIIIPNTIRVANNV